MGLAKVTIIPGGTTMTTNKQTITDQIAERLNAFNARLEAKINRRQAILENMRAEEDFGRSMEYLKEFFRSPEAQN